MSIFQICDIDYYFLNKCSIDIIINLSRVNKYYHSITFDILSPFRYCLNRTHFITNEKIDNIKYVNSCFCGNIDVFTYITSKSFISHRDMVIGFQFACMKNNIDIAKRIKMSNYDNLIAHDNYYAFRWACKARSFDTVFWMIDSNFIPEDKKHFLIEAYNNNKYLNITNFRHDILFNANFDWTKLFLQQLAFEKYDIAAHIAKTFGVNITVVCARIMRYVDIDIDVDQSFSDMVDQIIIGCIKSDYKVYMYNDILYDIVQNF